MVYIFGGFGARFKSAKKQTTQSYLSLRIELESNYLFKITISGDPLRVQQTNKMADSKEICSRLIDKRKWFRYTDTENISKVAGIYVIGEKRPKERPIKYLYLGQTMNVRERIMEHKHGDQKIDSFVKKCFRKNKGVSLRVKWIRHADHKKNEKKYIRCLEKIMGYKLEYNLRYG